MYIIYVYKQEIRHEKITLNYIKNNDWLIKTIFLKKRKKQNLYV